MKDNSTNSVLTESEDSKSHKYVGGLMINSAENSKPTSIYS